MQRFETEIVFSNMFPFVSVDLEHYYIYVVCIEVTDMRVAFVIIISQPDCNGQLFQLRVINKHRITSNF